MSGREDRRGRCPWYVSARAVREYAGLAGLDASTVAGFNVAELALFDVAERAHLVREQANGLDLYRGPRPHRVRLLVSPAPRTEGAKPQLVQVLPTSPRQRRGR